MSTLDTHDQLGALARRGISEIDNKGNGFRGFEIYLRSWRSWRGYASGSNLARVTICFRALSWWAYV